MENKTHISKEEYSKLHEQLAQLVINFFKDKGVPKDAWLIEFSFDDLAAAVKYGTWTPANDSFLGISNHQQEYLFTEM